MIAPDALTRAGLRDVLGNKPGIELLEETGDADVTVVMADTLPDELPDEPGRLVLVADNPSPASLWAAIEHGLAVLLPPAAATAERLLRAVADAHRGHGDVPSEQLGWLLRDLGRLHKQVLAPRELTLSGLSHRETEVLRLLADGLDTAEIATELAYSERTVKNILHTLLRRLDLRNRVHAVAHGVRHGLI